VENVHSGDEALDDSAAVEYMCTPPQTSAYSSVPAPSKGEDRPPSTPEASGCAKKTWRILPAARAAKLATPLRLLSARNTGHAADAAAAVAASTLAQMQRIGTNMI
jgi:hypothetical protein